MLSPWMTSALGGLNLPQLDVGTYWKMPAIAIIFTGICCGETPGSGGRQHKLHLFD